MSSSLGAVPGYRSGFVSIVGRPNVGKSTLLNAFLGRKIAITSAKPQTTRNAIRGVLSGERWQIVFIDTPGLHKPKTLLGKRLNDVARSTLSEVDAIVFLIDAMKPLAGGDRYVADQILQTKTPVICAVNKMDIAGPSRILPQLQAAADLSEWQELLPISAAKGTNVPELQQMLVDRLEEGPQFYPDDAVTDQPREMLLSEIIREKAITLTREEVPHSIAVGIDDIIERDDDITEIYASLYVERDSQKGIVIGRGGAMLRDIGTRARKDLEWLIGTQVFLKLQVKVAKDWQRDPKKLQRFGY